MFSEYGDQILISFLILFLIPSCSPWFNADCIFLVNSGLQSGYFVSPFCAPYATSSAFSVNAHAVAIERNIAFLIGTTIEY